MSNFIVGVNSHSFRTLNFSCSNGGPMYGKATIPPGDQSVYWTTNDTSHTFTFAASDSDFSFNVTVTEGDNEMHIEPSGSDCQLVIVAEGTDGSGDSWALLNIVDVK